VIHHFAVDVELASAVELFVVADVEYVAVDVAVDGLPVVVAVVVDLGNDLQLL